MQCKFYKKQGSGGSRVGLLNLSIIASQCMLLLWPQPQQQRVGTDSPAPARRGLPNTDLSLCDAGNRRRHSRHASCVLPSFQKKKIFPMYNSWTHHFKVDWPDIFQWLIFISQLLQLHYYDQHSSLKHFRALFSFLLTFFFFFGHLSSWLFFFFFFK